MNGLKPQEYSKWNGVSTEFIAKWQEHMVCKSQRPIYGLKQASRSWNIKFDQAIKSFYFDKSLDELCVYKRIKGATIVFLVL